MLAAVYVAYVSAPQNKAEHLNIPVRAVAHLLVAVGFPLELKINLVDHFRWNSIRRLQGYVALVVGMYGHTLAAPEPTPNADQWGGVFIPNSYRNFSDTPP